MDGLFRMYREEDEAPGMGRVESPVSILKRELTEQIALEVDLRKRITELETENETLRKRLWQTASELVQERHKEAWKQLGQE